MVVITPQSCKIYTLSIAGYHMDGPWTVLEENHHQLSLCCRYACLHLYFWPCFLDGLWTQAEACLQFCLCCPLLLLLNTLLAWTLYQVHHLAPSGTVITAPGSARTVQILHDCALWVRFTTAPWAVSSRTSLARSSNVDCCMILCQGLKIIILLLKESSLNYVLVVPI